MADLELRRAGRANRLAGQSSPYLAKHAHNPVDWYPWGAEAFAAARAGNKPIHLSIGYYACHWCSVLERESFEDEETARVLNEQFVNIKVDREERPDLDRIYQLAHQMLTQNGGGWPLTMFLTPDDHVPFFGGTYFPKEARFGLPPFRQVLERVAQYYRERQAELRAQNAALLGAFDSVLGSAGHRAGEVVLDATPLAGNRRELEAAFDRDYGGFGEAPKFPQPAALERLLRDWHASAGEAEPDLQALYMAALTLTRMADGGIRDQLAGGFSRYSVDRYWMIPHFEKMLYDNGALLGTYATAALATGDELYARVAGETAAWLLRDLCAPDGGFYSSFDADSEGDEGRFYVWERDAAEAALTPAEWSVFAPRFGFDRAPNFEGRWHAHVFRSIEDVAGGRTAAETRALIDSARAKLLAIRNGRIAPGRDEKILTSWNALAIRGLAIAARSLHRPELAEAASRALGFLRTHLWRDGRLLATYKDGHAHLNGYLDDYVFLADAVLELLQLRWRSDELHFLRQLLDATLAHFEDPAGGFFFTSDDHETLIHRMKTMADEATPSGNGIAAIVLGRAGYLLGETRYLDAAERTLRAAWPALERHPRSHTTLLTALEEQLHPPEILILRGDAAEIARWSRELQRLYAPRRLILAVPGDAAGLPPALASKRPRATAVGYLCRGPACSEPIDSLAALVQRLRSGIGGTTSAAARD